MVVVYTAHATIVIIKPLLQSPSVNIHRRSYKTRTLIDSGFQCEFTYFWMRCGCIDRYDEYVKLRGLDMHCMDAGCARIIYCLGLA